MTVSCFRFDTNKAARGTAARWKSTYWDNGKGWYYPGDEQETHKALVALGPDPKPEDVDATIGNDSWTTFMCDQCHEFGRQGIVIETPYHIIQLCDPCNQPLKDLLNG